MWGGKTSKTYFMLHPVKLKYPSIHVHQNKLNSLALFQREEMQQKD